MENQNIKAGMLKGEVMSDKLKDALNEAEKNKKKEKPKMLPELHALDDRIEEFIQKLEDKINAVKDNPIFVKKAFALLGDMSKEYSEFIAALRAIVNAVDRKGMSLPKEKPLSRVRDVNARHRDPEDDTPPPPEEGAIPPPEGGLPPKGVKEALTFEKKKGIKNHNIREALDEVKKTHKALDFMMDQMSNDENSTDAEMILHIAKETGNPVGQVSKMVKSERKKFMDGVIRQKEGRKIVSKYFSSGW